MEAYEAALSCLTQREDRWQIWLRYIFDALGDIIRYNRYLEYVLVDSRFSSAVIDDIFERSLDDVGEMASPLQINIELHGISLRAFLFLDCLVELYTLHQAHAPQQQHYILSVAHQRFPSNPYIAIR